MMYSVRIQTKFTPLLLAALLAACGGAQTQAPEAQVPAAAETPGAGAPPARNLAPYAPSQPYAYLWEQALQPKPYPRIGQDRSTASDHPGVLDPLPDDAGNPNADGSGYSNPTDSALPPGGTLSLQPPPELDPRTLAPYLQGVASWYGPSFHGKPTANGEVYNQYGLTAAHPVLPIGTKVEVENLENGRKVWVRINDRGPYAKGRVLDLSRIAAQHLGMIENGTTRVRITVLQWPENVNPNLGLKAYQQYVVQAAAYPDLDTAENLRERLQARFPQAPVMMDMAANGFFAVVAGPFDDEAEARRLSRQMQRQGIANIVRRYRN
jgi:rare lipoprotein A